MKIHLALIGIALLASSLSGKNHHPPPNHDSAQQSACESKLLRDMGAKEVLEGSEYETLANVVAAFGRDKTPRLYFFEGNGNAYYIAGSAAQDGRGKILMSRAFAELMGNTLALKGVMAHEMGHLTLDVRGGKGCSDWIYSNSETEQEADAVGASKVGFEPLVAFLLRIRELAGEKDLSEALRRLQALEALETQQKEQRN
jgi:hypothetical protein